MTRNPVSLVLCLYRVVMIISINDINVEVEHKNIKNMHLAVYPPDGRVHVSAPSGYTEDQVRLYVLKKWVWVSLKRDELMSFNIQPKREFVSGEAHYYKGQLYRLRVITGEAVHQHVEISGDYILLYARSGANRDKKEEILYSWYKTMLTPILEKFVAKWEGILDVKLNDWEIHQMAARWGSCSKEKKKVIFNLQLAKKPVRCIEYVVAHEMVHLIERNHTKRFRAIMDLHLPEWELIRKELNELPL